VGYREHLPHPALRPYVDRFWVRAPAHSPEAPTLTHVLPDGCVDVIVNLETGAARVVGTMTRAVTFANAGARLAAVRFRPGAAWSFLRLPLHELTDRALPARDCKLEWLEPPLDDPEPLSAVAALERVLLARLPSLPERNRLVTRAVRRLFEPSRPSIAELVRDTGRSRQYLDRVFRERVGIGPKVLARVARLQQAVYTLQSVTHVNLASLAVELGYFDQAHMARDFRLLAGVSAGQVELDPVSIFPIPSLWLDP
jgi:AraC-like DNA-binding protein